MIFIKRRFPNTKHIINYLILKFKYIHTSVKAKTAVNLEYQLFDDERTKNPIANPLVISHCLMGQSNNWTDVSKSLLEDLDPQRKIYVLDNRNHGNSPHTTEHNYKLMAEDYVQFYSTLGLKEAILLGHSMGGRACMYTALKYPEKVSSLIIIDISPIEVDDEMKKLLAEPLHLLKTLATLDLHKHRGNFLEVRKYVSNELKKLSVNAPEYREFLLQNINQNTDGSFGWKINIPTLIKDYSTFKNFNIGSLTYDKSMLLIACEKSKFVPKSHEEKIKKIFPNVRIEFVPKSGHLIHMENPKILCELVVNFLKYEK